MKAAVAIEVNGEEQDLIQPVPDGAQVRIITIQTPAGLDIMRHTITAQVLARAIHELYPGTKLAIGPTIEHGFYYDVDCPHTITPDDLPKIEARMWDIIKERNPVERIMIPREEAISTFADRSEPYKVEIMSDTPDQDAFPLYFQKNSDFVDLCRGPHLPSLDRIPHGSFKLTKISGAYWRGDAKNKMLTRVYGVAFATKKELKAHLRMLEEAENAIIVVLENNWISSISRRSGGTNLLALQRMDHIQQAQRIHPRKTAPIRLSRSQHTAHHFQNPVREIRTLGQVWNRQHVHYRSIWWSICTQSPMNCPCHVQIFNQGVKSYRDLPIRMSEFGNCMRHETRGSLHGIMRVTSMTQDDAHIFCTHEQIADEVVIL